MASVDLPTIVMTYQAADSPAPSAEEMAALVAAIENTTVLPHIRSKAITVLGQHAASQEPAVMNKTVSALVTVLGSTEATPPLNVACLNALTTLAGKLKTKQVEYIKEVTDTFLQVSMEENGYPENVRTVAKESIQAMLKLNPTGVITKLLHWISDEREADDVEYVAKERQVAFSMLEHLITTPSHGATWNDEAQNTVFRYMKLVIPVVSADQLSSLGKIAAHLPIVKASNGKLLLDAMLQHFKPEVLKTYQMMILINPHVSRTASCDELASKLFPLAVQHLVTRDQTTGVTPIAFAKVLCFASRLVSATAAETYLPTAFEVFNQMPIDDWTIVEAVLQCIGHLAHKNSVAALPRLKDDAEFATRVANVQATLEPMRVKVNASMHYLMKQHATMSPQHGEMFHCLQHVHAQLEAFHNKVLPQLSTPVSWETRRPLPKTLALSPPTGNGNEVSRALKYQAKRSRS